MNPTPMHESTWMRLWLCISLLACGVAAQEKEVAERLKDPATFYTAHDLVRQEAEFYRKLLTESYTRVGRTGAAWDEPARRFLDAVALHWAGLAQGRLYLPEGWASAAKVAELGKQAREKGCDDPLVLFCHTRMRGLRRGGDAATSAEVQKACDGVLAGKYPAMARLFATKRLLADGDGHLRQQAEDLVVEVCRGPFVNAAHRRRALKEAQEHLGSGPGGHDQRFLDRLAADKAVDPYIAYVIAGEREDDLAWKARGSGFAGEVTPEGWRGFRLHLAKAREHFTAAYKAQPDLPEAPAAMVRVAMADADAEEGELRLWFDRARAAQVDHQKTYDAMRWALRPRWGGSHEKMLEIGLEGVQSGRYDTSLPFQFVLAVVDVMNDRVGQNEPGDVIGSAEIYKKLQEVLRTYSERLPPERGSDWYRSWHAAIAFRAGKLEEARKLLDECETIETGMYAQLGAPRGETAVSYVYANTGAGKREVDAAVRLMKTGRPEEARRQLLEIAASLPPGDRSLLYIRDRAAVAGYLAEFASGKWATLTPGKGVVGWEPMRGQWATEPASGAVVGTADSKGLLLVCDPDFGQRYELVAEVEIPEARAGSTVLAGIMVDFTSFNREDHGLWAGADEQGLSVKFAVSGDADEHALAARRSVTLRLTAWDGRFRAFTDDQPLGEKVQRTPPRGLPWPRVGIGSPKPTAPGAAVRVKSVKIRRLDEEPKPGNE